MEPAPVPAAPGVLARLRSRLDWYWTLSPPGRAAFWATFGGWALDAYNQMTLGFVLPAVTAAFALSTTQAGLLGSVGLVMSAVGGAMAGALADAVGRVRVLILSIGSYALFTLLAGNTRIRPIASASAPATAPPTALVTIPTVASSPACVVESANAAVTAGRTKPTVIWL